ncbi:protoheme IX farnesyltransferase [Elstera litoralis]|uniref:Protoheme IX farnesyltransferase n=1 Tax=Elstera litoralis TaxID=552518 RepID=A0A0F3IZA6_9PROT|nr:heme o synthase [Elstera litoralis]KJV10944.1 protoheme IX farnesyltransferase [Elstera litoralis]
MSDVTVSVDTRGAVAQGATARDFFALLKPRVMSLVVFTGGIGLFLAPGALHPVLAFAAILCIAVGAGASGAINMWYDRDIDAIMTRTLNRPIPSGRVDPADALAFGIVLAVASVIVMGLAVGFAAALMLAVSIAFYVFVYTMWLKRRTPQNIVIGGAAGAFPPMIGWAAVTGDISLASVLLFAIIFMWTPPHFWALALFRCEDYTRAGVPMLPVTAGEPETKKQILLYALLLWPLTLAPVLIGTLGAVYAGVALVLGALFVAQAVAVARADLAATQYKAAKRLFGFSILYLFALFAVMPLDRWAGLPVPAWMMF